jgi:hypothetical protein
MSSICRISTLFNDTDGRISLCAARVRILCYALVLFAFAQSCSVAARGVSAEETAAKESAVKETAAKARAIMRESGLRMSADTTKAYSYDPPGSLNTNDKPITFQERKTFAFEQAGVYFSNEFAGARLNGVVMENDSSFIATISPENAPINFSAWYAFKAWSKSPRSIRLTLRYTEARHRYVPKLARKARSSSVGGAVGSLSKVEMWKPIDSASYWKWYDKSGRDVTSATLRLDLNADTLYVVGQELFTSADFERWSADLAAAKPFVKKTSLGRSAEGRSIIRLDISEAPENAPCVVVISRQHPPEVTGTLGLLPFIEELASDSELARRFRKQFRVFVAPCVNPDGVDEGHWRHNARGVDLNRDWFNFNQPETRAVRDALLDMRREHGTRFVFGVDFHTTQHDIFYTLSNPPLTTASDSAEYAANPAYREYNDEAAARSKFVETWLDGVQQRFPTYQVVISDSPRTPGGATSGRWFDRELKAPAVTYEVGDETDRDLIRRVGATSAQILMEMLLQR